MSQYLTQLVAKLRYQRMALAASEQEANAAAKRWYAAASPYATPEALREALADVRRYQLLRQSNGRDGVMTNQVAPSAEALRIAREFVSEPNWRAQVKVNLAINGHPLIADMIDEAVLLAREILRLAELKERT